MKETGTKLSIVVLLFMLVSETISAQVKYSQQDVNEMSYNLGITHAKGLKAYLETEMQMDIKHLDSFIMGLQGTTNNSIDKDEDAYNIGSEVYQSTIKTMISSINQELFGDSLAEHVLRIDY